MPATTKYQSYGLSTLYLGLLLFWALWFCIACLTNIADLLVTWQILPETWPFRSSNFAQLASTISLYSLSPAFAALLLLVDILIQGTIATLFGIAVHKWRQNRTPWKWVNAALILSIALWAIFSLMDELFIAYSYESTHLTLLISSLLTLIVMHRLPLEK